MTQWTEFVDAAGPDGAYLPWKKVELRVGISRTTAWRLQKTGDFPKPYVISPGRVAYRESEIEAWKASRGHRSAAHRKVRPAATAAPSRGRPQEPASAPEPLDLAGPAAGRQSARAPAPRRRARKPPDASQMSFDF
ncbi:MAG: AlpA family phage regulatory protein [Proteobacteria bacterium]|nr:AlpA family phage regulatory protein [Pseudomonadota bacterium]